MKKLLLLFWVLVLSAAWVFAQAEQGTGDSVSSTNMSPDQNQTITQSGGTGQASDTTSISIGPERDRNTGIGAPGTSGATATSSAVPSTSGTASRSSSSSNLDQENPSPTGNPSTVISQATGVNAGTTTKR